MLTTLYEARTSTLKNIAGFNAGDENHPPSQAFIDALNEATRRLMRRGDWSGTVVPMRVVSPKGMVTWPRYVGQVRRINVCRQPVPIFGQWYEFLQFGDHHHHWGHWAGEECVMVGQFQAATYNDVFVQGGAIRAYPQYASDAGRNVQIFGVDTNGLPLRTANTNGTYTDGITLQLAVPFVQSNVTVGRIDRVIKDVTQGNVMLYCYDADSGNELDLASYEPSETNPAYVRYQLCLPTHGQQIFNVVALVKIKYISVKVDTDLVLIQNLDALKLMMQCVKFEEAGERSQARACEADAIRELNLELADETPQDQIPVSVEPFNGMSFNQRCF